MLYYRYPLRTQMNFLVVKNAEHSEATGVLELVPAVGAFAQAILRGAARPVFKWSIDPVSGNITATTDTQPLSVTVAVADSAGGISAGKRDFRWAALNVSFCPIKVFGACVRPVFWATYPVGGAGSLTSTDKYSAERSADGKTFVVGVPLPPAGVWRAFMIEAKWANPSGPDNFEFTTGVSVVPDTYPFPDCKGAECTGLC